MKYVLLAASLMLVFAAPMGLATHEESDCEMEAPPGEVVAVGPLYLNDRPGPDSPFGTGLLTGGGTWIYLEDNGIDGLQTDAEFDSTNGDQEICGHNPDLLIF